MNLAILDTEVQLFIKQNLNSDITKLILKGSPFKNVSVQELANQIIANKKSEQKLPSWFSSKNIYYPLKISIEQTSSEITANYKASLINGKSMIDITGGFGVDCYAFSKHFKEVTHCEINSDLSTIVNHNYKQLKVKNIETFSGNGLDYLKKSDKSFDCIYIDPSRRNETKGKVFLLKDCLPNVPENIDFLFTKTTQILIKNSPILDITSTINELKYVKEIHVVAINNEVKELIFLLEKNTKKEIDIKTINIVKNTKQTFNFKYKQEANTIYTDTDKYLYEPNAAILKAGGFIAIANQLNVLKIAQHSHLYTSKELIDFPGRCFKVEHVLNYDKKKIKQFLKNNKANITTRNFPKSVAQIRKETKIKEGGNQYLFFTTYSSNKLVVIICTKAIKIEINS